ncbi:MAG: phosphodiester glycosidase family protein [Candidatus Eremiobacteraeota bacterium]|nr:phosphodiester glycosidase family protein [Candidatus Eremiobacteraeota bacterium]
MSFRMRLELTVFIAFICLAPQPTRGDRFPQPVGWPRIARAELRSDETLGPGVRHARWRLDTARGPLELSIATIDLHNPFVALVAGSQQGTVQGPGERLSAMADRLHAQLGVNADYFDINESGAPLNVLVENGRMLHQPDAAAAFIAGSGNKIVMQTMHWQALVTAAGGRMVRISTLNEWASASNLALITQELGPTTAGAALEVVLTPSQQPRSPAQVPLSYRVEQVNVDASALVPLANGDLGVAANGGLAQSLAQDFKPGDVVTVDMQSEPAADSITTAVGGGPLLLRDGAIAVDPAPPAPEETDVRNPVTGAGVSADGGSLWLIVVDGRAPSRSVGLTRPMFGALFASLGAANAMAFDSGGSSEMVVRHLGDGGVSVANTPSDGRERGIADGLFVVNTALVGPVQRLLIKAPAQSVLTGSHLQLFASGVDEHDQPIPLAAQDVSYTVEPTDAARIDAGGVLRAKHAADIRLTAHAANASTEVSLRVLAAVASMRVVGAPRVLPAGMKSALAVQALDDRRLPVAVDPEAIHWTSQGNGGSIDPFGTFTAGARAGLATVRAQIGMRTAELTLASGEHTQWVQRDLRAGGQPPLWSFRAQPADIVAGAADESPAPSGERALRLRYDFSAAAAIRAAYVQSVVALCGQPIAVSLDVYGDGNGAWLRGGYRNADGNAESLTLARHVDWRGWKRLRVAFPFQAAWPVTWTRFYVVERAPQAHESGSLWLRRFAAVYAGPATLGCQGI